ncbi:hypothetical protein [Empedobacter sp. ULE_I140]
MGLGGKEWIILIILMGVITIPYILFLKTLQNTIKEISLENRKINPNDVWLILIPLFGIIWQMIVINKISISLGDELNKKNIGNNEVKPTFALGIAYCILQILTVIPIAGILFGLIAFILWIIYWVKIESYKTLLKRD